MTLINQPTRLPTRKVAAGTLAGAISAAVIAAVRVYQPDLAAAVSPIIEQITPVVVAFVASYLTRERAA